MHPRRLLDYLTALTKVDLRYALSGGFFLTLTQISSAVIALGLTIAFANLIPIETYGTYRYILATYALISIAALPGIDTAVLQSVSRGFDRSFMEGVRIKFRWSLLGTFGGLLYAGYLYAQGSPVMANLFIIMAIAVPFMESFALYTSFLNGKKQFRLWAVLDICTQVVSAAVLLATLFYTDNIVAIVLAYFVPNMALRLLATLYVRASAAKDSEQDPGLRSYSRSMTAFQIISRLISSIDQIVLYHFLGPAQVAIYSLAIAIPMRIQSVLRITGTLALPKYAKRDSRDIATSLPRKMILFGAGILAVCAAYVIAAPLVFTYIFPQYLPSLAYSQAAVFLTLSAITYPFGSYLFAHKKVVDTYTFAIAGFLSKVICLVTLVPFFGIWGAIVGLIANSLVTILITALMLARDRSLPSSDSGSIDLSPSEPLQKA